MKPELKERCSWLMYHINGRVKPVMLYYVHSRARGGKGSPRSALNLHRLRPVEDQPPGVACGGYPSDM